MISSYGKIVTPNNRINSDWQFRCAPLPAGYASVPEALRASGTPG
jgi:hypothetical protein